MERELLSDYQVELITKERIIKFNKGTQKELYKYRDTRMAHDDYVRSIEIWCETCNKLVKKYRLNDHFKTKSHKLLSNISYINERI